MTRHELNDPNESPEDREANLAELRGLIDGYLDNIEIGSLVLKMSDSGRHLYPVHTGTLRHGGAIAVEGWPVEDLYDHLNRKAEYLDRIASSGEQSGVPA